MKLLLIGIGRWGKNHLRVLSGLCDELYVSDLDRSQLDGVPILAGHFSTRYQDFLDRVDAVDIVTPTDSHLRICRECLEKGKDVFIEKPLTFGSDGAKEIIDQEKKNGRILQVGHIYRYHPATSRIKQIIEEGHLGIIKYAYGHFTEFKRPRTDIGVTQTDAIHYFDLFNYLFGTTPRTVTSVIRNYLNLFYDDTSVSILDYQGRIVTIEAGYMSPEKRRDIVIVGDRASLYCDFQENHIHLYDNHHEMQGERCIAMKGDVQESFIGPKEPLTIELEAFLESVRNRSKPLSDGQAGYEALKIVEACYESSRKGKTVEIEW